MLGSQSPRAGMDRSYMVSRKRGMPWMWIGIGLVGIAIAGVWLWWGGDRSNESQAATAAGVNPPVSQQANGTLPSESAPRRNVVEAAPPPSANRRPLPEGVPTMTLDRPGTTAPIGQPTPSETFPKVSNTEPQAPPTTPTKPGTTVAQARTLAANYGSSDATLAKGMELIADEKYVEGRAVLSQLLLDAPQRLTPADAQTVRDTLTSINQELVFSPVVAPGDPVAEAYVVQSGDLLSRIAPRYKTPYQFIEKINGVDARRIQVGQKIKVVQGPFHARVSKDGFRMDLFLAGKDGQMVYVRSYPVGLGESDSTPLGSWIVTPGRKAVNPDWRNPRTGEYYRPNDPDNPIGEYWLALTGTDENTKTQQGYGIHGTIDPASIGTQASMGCIRLSDNDVKDVYHMLWEGASTVEIVP